MDYGRFISASFENSDGQTTLNGGGCAANKGIAIQLGEGEAAMLFDTDLCRMAGGWTGGFVNRRGVTFDGGHGPNPGPAFGARKHFEVNPGPGWSSNGSFTDPRPLPKGPGAAKVPFGPLPKSWARYRGLLHNGDDVILTYTVGAAGVYEKPALEKVGDIAVLTRSLTVVGSFSNPTPAMVLADAQGDAKVALEGGVAVVTRGDMLTVIAAKAGDMPAEIALDGLRVIARPGGPAGSFKIAYANGSASSKAALVAAVGGVKPVVDLAKENRTHPLTWKEPVIVSAAPSKVVEGNSYVVDTIPVPFENPYRAWMRIGALDFFSNGDAAVSTWSGDVWVVSGLNGDLSRVTWRRFATGLFQPLGLRIVKDLVYVTGRDQITRLRDINGDGQADAYECFNNDVQVTPGFHEFTFDLQTDAAGNFYFAKGGPVNPGGRGWGPLSDHNGAIFKVSPDGTTFDIYATGVRAPNGLGVGPQGQVSVADNEGTWVPACYISMVKPGGFVSVTDLAHREVLPTDYARHLCFLPHKTVDNSSGGQVWVSGEKWGYPAERMLHLSYGKSSLYGVLSETVGDVIQGGVFKWPVQFESGVMRGRFSPVDGQLYVVGLKGWQSTAAKDGCFQRVRYLPGRMVTLPDSLRVRSNGISIGFTAPLDEKSAADPQNYSVQQWNYKWSKEYGSPDLKVSDPKEKGRDSVEVKSVKLSNDKKTVFLELGTVVPVMQMEIKMNIQAADGSAVPAAIHNTIHVVPGA
jgi:hypothetical protein